MPETISDFIRSPVDIRFQTRPYRDSLGRLHFPGPPMFLKDPHSLNVNRRFSDRPYFLKPEYLAPLYWGPDGSMLPRNRTKARETEALRALLDYMKKNPETTVGQLLQQLEAGKL